MNKSDSTQTSFMFTVSLTKYKKLFFFFLDFFEVILLVTPVSIYGLSTIYGGVTKILAIEKKS